MKSCVNLLTIYISASPPCNNSDTNIHDVLPEAELCKNIFMLTTADETILVDLDFQNPLQMKQS